MRRKLMTYCKHTEKGAVRKNSPMSRVLATIAFFSFLTTQLLTLASCSTIDEDRSDCENEFRVNYEVKLRTNISTQIQTVLRSRFETEVANLLEDSLKNIFREYAHDVDLSFYVGDNRQFHDFKLMLANQATYELELPADNYRHLAVANIEEEAEVDLLQSEGVERSHLFQEVADTIDGHHTGLFSARQNMNIVGNQNQTFDVTLYMANCASILVLRTDNVAYNDVKVLSTDFADDFLVNDSVYRFNHNYMVRDLRVTRPPVEREVFYSVTFPSHDTAEEAQGATTRPSNGVEIDNDGSTGAEDSERIWRKFVYVTLPDGSITRTVINVRQPLKAGQIFIIYAYLKPDGSIYSPNVEVSTSVTLDWKEGLVIEH